MSLLRTIKHQLGLSSTTNNNFLLDASADNGTMKLARESGQDIMTVDTAGKPRFNQLAQSLNGSGYKELDGGLIIQWGTASIELNSVTSASTAVTFPIPFPTSCLVATMEITNSNTVAELLKVATTVCSNKTASGFSAAVYAVIGNTLNATLATNWIAIGY